jgi:periplasmic protein TonB
VSEAAKPSPSRSRARRNKSGIPIARTLGIVVGIHVALGAGLFALAQTEVGQRVIEEYKVKLAQEKPPEKEPPKPPEKPPEPPKPQKALEAPLPQVAAAAPTPSAGSAPQLGDAGPGLTYGGKFAAPSGKGSAVGAFNSAVERRFRQHYKEPHDNFGAAVLDVRVDGNGKVVSFQLARSSGNAGNDAAILAAAERLQQGGVMAPPKGRERVVTVKVTPY